MKTKTLLICTIPDLRPAIIGALGKHFNLVFCYTMREALAAMRRPVDAIGCGIHFAEGQAFEFLQIVKENPKTCHIPFFMGHGSRSHLPAGMSYGIEVATRALGGQGVIPFRQWRDQMGDEKAFEKLRATFNRALADVPRKSTFLPRPQAR